MNKKLLLSVFTSLAMFLLPLASGAALAPGDNLEKLEFGTKFVSPAGQIRGGQADILMEQADGPYSNPAAKGVDVNMFADLCGSCHRNINIKNSVV